MHDHTKLRAFELADEVALLIDMTFAATNHRLWVTEKVLSTLLRSMHKN